MKNRVRGWIAMVCGATVIMTLPLTAGAVIVGADQDPADMEELRTSIAGTAGETFGGVGKLFVHQDSGTYGCSGTLLAGGAYMVTAAHCVTDSAGNLSATTTVDVSFAGTAEATTAAEIIVHADWNGDVIKGNDIAILKLATPVTTVDGYQIYTGNQEIDNALIKVGYGLSGTGDTGYDGSAYGFGTKRMGVNSYDATGKDMPRSWRMDDSQLMYDFDSGDAANDALGYYFGLGNLGYGIEEVMAAPGDSGGASFFFDGLNYYLSGITSFLLRLSGTDIDGGLNASYGELGGDTRVSSFASWIGSILDGIIPTGKKGKGGGGGDGCKGGPKKCGGAQYTLMSLDVVVIPEPGTLAIFAAGLFGLMGARRRKVSRG